MLFIRAEQTWEHTFRDPFSFVAVISARSARECNDIGVDARIAEFGVRIVEGRWNGSTDRAFAVVLKGSEAQLVGFLRSRISTRANNQRWFVIARRGGDEVIVEHDGGREQCELTIDGFVLPDGKAFTAGKIYVPAQYNTALAHHRGHYVGETLA